MITKSIVGGNYIYADDSSAAFTQTELAQLNLMMQDFGFSTQYSYKVQDKDFEQATTYKATFTVKYNVEDDEADVTPTPEIPDESEIPDETDIPEETDKPNIDEDIDPPKTGDSTAKRRRSSCFALSGLCAVALCGRASPQPGRKVTHEP